MSAAVVFASSCAALYVAHSVGDHWVQTSCQAARKGGEGWSARWACVRHVATLTATKTLLLLVTLWVLDLSVSLVALVAALGVDAVSHYWADRRTTLAALARLLGRAEFHALGGRVVDPDGRPTHLGTGAYALDQSWHHLWLWVAALIIAGGAA